MHEVSSLCVLDWKELRSVRAPSALNKILPNFCFCIAYLGIFSMLHSSINKIILILGGVLYVIRVLLYKTFYSVG